MLTSLEGMAQMNTYFPMTCLHALAQICDTNGFFTPTASCTGGCYSKFFILSGVSFVENSFTEDKAELSYTYFYGVLP